MGVFHDDTSLVRGSVRERESRQHRCIAFFESKYLAGIPIYKDSNLILDFS